MDGRGFSPGGILRVIFRYVTESPRVLAEQYLYRDRTLVYKWLHDSATPSKGMVAGIVAFVMDRACEPVRLSLRRELEGYVSSGGLDPAIAAGLVATASFEAFLRDSLLLALSLPDVEGSSPGRPPSASGPTKRSLPLAELGLALLAVLGSGILWNATNRLLGWTYYMGGEGREPQGLAAALWGLSVALPLILAAMAARSGDGNRPRRPTPAVALAALYGLAGTAGALAFYDSGLRPALEGLRLAYLPQESLIACVFALTVSLLPFAVLTAAAALSRTGLPARFLPAYAFLPAAMVTSAVLITCLVDRPPSELEQLRGFLAGLMLRTGMYLVARLAFREAAGKERAAPEEAPGRP